MPISKNTLSKYRKHSDIFIETGTYNGSTVQKANELGFKKIYSIESSHKWYNFTSKYFKDQAHIEILKGQSVKVLPILLNKIDVKCVFWLDAHSVFKKTKVKPYNPIFDELHAISQHKIKDHTILIDDIPLFKDKIMNYEKKIIICLNTINKKYKIDYLYGFFDGEDCEKNYILVASL